MENNSNLNENSLAIRGDHQNQQNISQNTNQDILNMPNAPAERWKTK